MAGINERMLGFLNFPHLFRNHFWDIFPPELFFEGEGHIKGKHRLRKFSTLDGVYTHTNEPFNDNRRQHWIHELDGIDGVLVANIGSVCPALNLWSTSRFQKLFLYDYNLLALNYFQIIIDLAKKGHDVDLPALVLAEKEKHQAMLEGLSSLDRQAILARIGILGKMYGDIISPHQFCREGGTLYRILKSKNPVIPHLQKEEFSVYWLNIVTEGFGKMLDDLRGYNVSAVHVSNIPDYITGRHIDDKPKKEHVKACCQKLADNINDLPLTNPFLLITYYDSYKLRPCSSILPVLLYEADPENHKKPKPL